jgi:small-conductance mechanosensitive channel
VLTGLILRAIGGQNRSTSVLFGEKLFDGALFPWLLFGLAVVSRNLVLPDTAPVLARPGLPLLLSLAVIRLAVRVLRAAFPRSPGVRLVERRLSWAAWIGVVLWLTGVLPIVLAELDEIGWKLGSARLTLRALVEGLFNAVFVLMFVVWFSALIESKLIGARTDNLSLRKMASNASRSLLFFLGLLMALSAAGIDLTAVSVFGGAIGVGLGLGLQKLASNYVSGFVILAERSLHIGDVVKVDNFEGRIIDINTRSTIIRADNGRLAIVPNEMLVTQRVENASKADPSVQASTTFLVPHGADFAALSPRLLEAVKAVGRVLDQPGKRSAVYLSNFLTEGMELTVSYWVGDPANGQANVRSDVNEAILRVLRESGYKLALPSGAAAPPSGATASPSGATALPSGSTALPSGSTALPSSAAASPSGAADPLG